jgi:hypothetical protein
MVVSTQTPSRTAQLPDAQLPDAGHRHRRPELRRLRLLGDEFRLDGTLPARLAAGPVQYHVIRHNYLHGHNYSDDVIDFAGHFVSHSTSAVRLLRKRRVSSSVCSAPPAA